MMVVNKKSVPGKTTAAMHGGQGSGSSPNSMASLTGRELRSRAVVGAGASSLEESSKVSKKISSKKPLEQSSSPATLDDDVQEHHHHNPPSQASEMESPNLVGPGKKSRGLKGLSLGAFAKRLTRSDAVLSDGGGVQSNAVMNVNNDNVPVVSDIEKSSEGNPIRQVSSGDVGPELVVAAKSSFKKVGTKPVSEKRPGLRGSGGGVILANSKPAALESQASDANLEHEKRRKSVMLMKQKTPQSIIKSSEDTLDPKKTPRSVHFENVSGEGFGDDGKTTTTASCQEPESVSTARAINEGEVVFVAKQKNIHKTSGEKKQQQKHGVSNPKFKGRLTRGMRGRRLSNDMSSGDDDNDMDGGSNVDKLAETGLDKSRLVVVEAENSSVKERESALELSAVDEPVNNAANGSEAETHTDNVNDVMAEKVASGEERVLETGGTGTQEKVRKPAERRKFKRSSLQDAEKQVEDAQERILRAEVRWGACDTASDDCSDALDDNPGRMGAGTTSKFVTKLRPEKTTRARIECPGTDLPAAGICVNVTGKKADGDMQLPAISCEEVANEKNEREACEGPEKSSEKVVAERITRRRKEKAPVVADTNIHTRQMVHEGQAVAEKVSSAKEGLTAHGQSAGNSTGQEVLPVASEKVMTTSENNLTGVSSVGVTARPAGVEDTGIIDTRTEAATAEVEEVVAERGRRRRKGKGAAMDSWAHDETLATEQDLDQEFQASVNNPKEGDRVPILSDNALLDDSNLNAEQHCLIVIESVGEMITHVEVESATVSKPDNIGLIEKGKRKKIERSREAGVVEAQIEERGSKIPKVLGRLTRAMKERGLLESGGTNTGKVNLSAADLCEAESSEPPLNQNVDRIVGEQTPEEAGKGVGSLQNVQISNDKEMEDTEGGDLQEAFALTGKLSDIMDAIVGDSRQENFITSTQRSSDAMAELNTVLHTEKSTDVDGLGECTPQKGTAEEVADQGLNLGAECLTGKPKQGKSLGGLKSPGKNELHKHKHGKMDDGKEILTNNPINKAGNIENITSDSMSGKRDRHKKQVTKQKAGDGLDVLLDEVRAEFSSVSQSAKLPSPSKNPASESSKTLNSREAVDGASGQAVQAEGTSGRFLRKGDGLQPLRRVWVRGDRKLLQETVLEGVTPLSGQAIQLRGKPVGSGQETGRAVDPCPVELNPEAGSQGKSPTQTSKLRRQELVESGTKNGESTKMSKVIPTETSLDENEEDYEDLCLGRSSAGKGTSFVDLLTAQTAKDVSKRRSRSKGSKEGLEELCYQDLLLHFLEDGLPRNVTLQSSMNQAGAFHHGGLGGEAVQQVDDVVVVVPSGSREEISGNAGHNPAIALASVDKRDKVLSGDKRVLDLHVKLMKQKKAVSEKDVQSLQKARKTLQTDGEAKGVTTKETSKGNTDSQGTCPLRAGAEASLNTVVMGQCEPHPAHESDLSLGRSPIQNVQNVENKGSREDEVPSSCLDVPVSKGIDASVHTIGTDAVSSINATLPVFSFRILLEGALNATLDEPLEGRVSVQRMTQTQTDIQGVQAETSTHDLPQFCEYLTRGSQGVEEGTSSRRQRLSFMEMVMDGAPPLTNSREMEGVSEELGPSFVRDRDVGLASVVQCTVEEHIVGMSELRQMSSDTEEPPLGRTARDFYQSIVLSKTLEDEVDEEVICGGCDGEIPANTEEEVAEDITLETRIDVNGNKSGLEIVEVVEGFLPHVHALIPEDITVQDDPGLIRGRDHPDPVSPVVKELQPPSVEEEAVKIQTQITPLPSPLAGQMLENSIGHSDTLEKVSSPPQNSETGEKVKQMAMDQQIGIEISPCETVGERGRDEVLSRNDVCEEESIGRKLQCPNPDGTQALSPSLEIIPVGGGNNVADDVQEFESFLTMEIGSQDKSFEEGTRAVESRSGSLEDQSTEDRKGESVNCLARDGDIGLEDTESQVVIEQGQVCSNSIGLRGDGEQLALLKGTLSIQGIQELGTEQGLEHTDTEFLNGGGIPVQENILVAEEAATVENRNASQREALLMDGVKPIDMSRSDQLEGLSSCLIRAENSADPAAYEARIETFVEEPPVLRGDLVEQNCCVEMNSEGDRGSLSPAHKVEENMKSLCMAEGLESGLSPVEEDLGQSVPMELVATIEGGPNPIRDEEVNLPTEHVGRVSFKEIESSAPKEVTSALVENHVVLESISQRTETEIPVPSLGQEDTAQQPLHVCVSVSRTAVSEVPGDPFASLSQADHDGSFVEAKIPETRDKLVDVEASASVDNLKDEPVGGKHKSERFLAKSVTSSLPISIACQEGDLQPLAMSCEETGLPENLRTQKGSLAESLIGSTDEVTDNSGRDLVGIEGTEDLPLTQNTCVQKGTAVDPILVGEPRTYSIPECPEVCVEGEYDSVEMLPLKSSCQQVAPTQIQGVEEVVAEEQEVGMIDACVAGEPTGVARHLGGIDSESISQVPRLEAAERTSTTASPSVIEEPLIMWRKSPWSDDHDASFGGTVHTRVTLEELGQGNEGVDFEVPLEIVQGPQVEHNYGQKVSTGLVPDDGATLAGTEVPVLGESALGPEAGATESLAENHSETIDERSNGGPIGKMINEGIELDHSAVPLEEPLSKHTKSTCEEQRQNSEITASEMLGSIPVTGTGLGPSYTQQAVETGVQCLPEKRSTNNGDVLALDREQEHASPIVVDPMKISQSQQVVSNQVHTYKKKGRPPVQNQGTPNRARRDGAFHSDPKRKKRLQNPGGRRVRPRPIDPDQPVIIFVEGRDKRVQGYDGGALFQWLQQQDEGNHSKSPGSLLGAGNSTPVTETTSRMHSTKEKPNIAVPSFRIVADYEERQQQLEKKKQVEMGKQIGSVAYGKKVNSKRYRASDYDMDDEDEKWLHSWNQRLSQAGLQQSLSEDKFEEIIEFLERASAELSIENPVASCQGHPAVHQSPVPSLSPPVLPGSSSSALGLSNATSVTPGGRVSKSPVVNLPMLPSGHPPRSVRGNDLHNSGRKAKGYLSTIDSISPASAIQVNTRISEIDSMLERAEAGPSGKSFEASALKPSDDCCICNGGEDDENNPVYTCKQCSIHVHQSCYGIREKFRDDNGRVIAPPNWCCRKCEAVAVGKAESNVSCALCRKRGGALKPTVEPQRWAHVACALYTNETFFVDPDAMEPIDGIAAVEARVEKRQYRCGLCGVKKGTCSTCCVKGCGAPFHISCGVSQGASFELRHSKQRVVGVRSFCPRHAGITPLNFIPSAGRNESVMMTSSTTSGAAASATATGSISTASSMDNREVGSTWHIISHPERSVAEPPAHGKDLSGLGTDMRGQPVGNRNGKVQQVVGREWTRGNSVSEETVTGKNAPPPERMEEGRQLSPFILKRKWGESSACKGLAGDGKEQFVESACPAGDKMGAQVGNHPRSGYQVAEPGHIPPEKRIKFKHGGGPALVHMPESSPMVAQHRDGPEFRKSSTNARHTDGAVSVDNVAGSPKGLTEDRFASEVRELLILEEAMKSDVAPPHIIREAFVYWRAKRAKHNGSLLCELQHERWSRTLGIFNKDAVEDNRATGLLESSAPTCPPGQRPRPNSSDDILDRTTEFRKQLERVRSITQLVVQRERLKHQEQVVLGNLAAVQLNIAQRDVKDRHCLWCSSTKNLLKCETCPRSFCFNCFKHRKGFGVKGWVAALKQVAYVCNFCQEMGGGVIDFPNILDPVSSLLAEDGGNATFPYGSNMLGRDKGKGKGKGKGRGKGSGRGWKGTDYTLPGLLAAAPDVVSTLSGQQEEQFYNPKTSAHGNKQPGNRFESICDSGLKAMKTNNSHSLVERMSFENTLRRMNILQSRTSGPRSQNHTHGSSDVNRSRISTDVREKATENRSADAAAASASQYLLVYKKKKKSAGDMSTITNTTADREARLSSDQERFNPPPPPIDGSAGAASLDQTGGEKVIKLSELRDATTTSQPPSKSSCSVELHSSLLMKGSASISDNRCNDKNNGPQR